MIAKFIGEDVFMRGIRVYMKKHAYGNAKVSLLSPPVTFQIHGNLSFHQTSDLWAALSEFSGIDVSKLMKPWVEKVGYPVVSVIETKSGIHIDQNRYLQTADTSEEENETLYPVFVGLSTEADGVQEHILRNSRSMDIDLDTTQFFELNTGHYGFYRVLYSPERLLNLGHVIQAGKLQVDDRIGLITDAGALAASGHQNTSALLGLLAGLSHETDSLVWNGILAQLTLIEKAWMFQPEEVRSALRRFKRDLVSARAKAIGWTVSTDDSFLMQQHKAAMFKAAGEAGEKE